MKNLFDLTGKVALVTGASSGMGKAIAEAMGEHGATIIISSNDEEACKKTLSEFKEKNIAAGLIVCDVAKKESIDNLINKALAFKNKIDILVSCVGIVIPSSTLEITANDFEKTMSINLQSAVYLTKLVIPQMSKRKDGVLFF